MEAISFALHIYRFATRLRLKGAVVGPVTATLRVSVHDILYEKWIGVDWPTP